MQELELLSFNYTAADMIDEWSPFFRLIDFSSGSNNSGIWTLRILFENLGSMESIHPAYVNYSNFSRPKLLNSLFSCFYLGEYSFLPAAKLSLYVKWKGYPDHHELPIQLSSVSNVFCIFGQIQFSLILSREGANGFVNSECNSRNM